MLEICAVFNPFRYFKVVGMQPESFSRSLHSKELKEEIAYRVRQYSYCIMNNTKNYKEWLEEDYERKLRSHISRLFAERL